MINAIAGYKEPANLTRYQHMGREQVTIQPAKGGRLNVHAQPWSKEPHNHPDHRSRPITRDTRKQICLVIDAKETVRTPALPRTTPPTQSSPGNEKGTHTSIHRNTASYTSSTSSEAGITRRPQTHTHRHLLLQSPHGASQHTWLRVTTPGCGWLWGFVPKRRSAAGLP